MTAALAVLTCPCHLPLWMALLGGAAVGAARSRRTRGSPSGP